MRLSLEGEIPGSNPKLTTDVRNTGILGSETLRGGIRKCSERDEDQRRSR